MRIKFNKEIEFLVKKFFISEKYLLKRRLKKAIKKNYEEELRVLEKIVNKNEESVDVGVYRGVYTYKLSYISKHVHSFEPNPLILPYLEKNLKKIVDNMTLYNLALSNVVTIADLKIPKRFNTINKNDYEQMYKLGCSTIHKKNFLNNEDFITHKVKTTKLDNLLLKKNIGFIKIDVEGHEKNVIKGAESIIKIRNPNLLVEIEELHSKEKVEDTINFINSLGYKSYYYDKLNLIKTSKLSNYMLKNNYVFLK